MILSVLLSLFNEIFDSIYIVFASFKPCIVVHATYHLVHLFELGQLCCVMKAECMRRWHNLITCPNDKKHWSF